MDRLLIALALGAVAIGVALLLQRRRSDPPSQPAPVAKAPEQLDRSDFTRPDAPWLVVVFSSATCSTCAGVLERAFVLESEDVAVQDVEAVRDRGLHRRYGIDAVPIVAIADAEGVVRQSFVGPVSSTHLWAAVAELRSPGSVPAGCEGDHDEAPPEPTDVT